MKFSYTILYVSHVMHSVVFYEKAFSLKRKFVLEEGPFAGQYAEMDTGETTLAFAAAELAQENLPVGIRKNNLSDPPAGVEIAFTTDNVEQAYVQAVAMGAVEVAPPHQKPWGQTVSYVRDVDGILVEICSPM